MKSEYESVRKPRLVVLLEAITEAGATIKAVSDERANWLYRLRNFRVGMSRLRL